MPRRPSIPRNFSTLLTVSLSLVHRNIVSVIFLPDICHCHFFAASQIRAVRPTTRFDRAVHGKWMQNFTISVNIHSISCQQYANHISCVKCEFCPRSPLILVFTLLKIQWSAGDRLGFDVVLAKSLHDRFFVCMGSVV